ncbi:MAG: hypothetical protein BJ554DRAFT_3726 [Olpidium bornovanus]|uniref:Uncharacterized protein n=1 Tax=Olpidium bornovanus TaxID=278681 RepID=A0A8H7ZNS5_9FUNG|nr:MAG: hypothetical protein BJ554DRAFT_3726 [Olpidium bornovanus]
MGKLSVVKKAQLAGKVTSITFDTQPKGGTEGAAGEHKPDHPEHAAPAAGSEAAPAAARKHGHAGAAAAAAQPASSAPKKVVIYAGTGNSNIYKIDMETFVPEMLSTCHYSQVNDICFPL